MPNSGNPEDQEHRPQGEDQVYGITTAETSHMEEITRRQKQYILTMLVRVVSIIVVVSVPGISWPIKIGLCLVATIIPYVAVVRANGGPSPQKDPTNLLIGPPPREELGSTRRELPKAGEQPVFIKGDFFVKDEATYRTGRGAGTGADSASQASTAGGYVRRAALPDDAAADAGTADPMASDQGSDCSSRPSGSAAS